jgi:hypothetical protein
VPTFVDVALRRNACTILDVTGELRVSCALLFCRLTFRLSLGTESTVLLLELTNDGERPREALAAVVARGTQHGG